MRSSKTSSNCCDVDSRRACPYYCASYRGVAQPGSAPEWGSGGRRFKSSRPDQSKQGYRFSPKPFFFEKVKLGNGIGKRARLSVAGARDLLHFSHPRRTPARKPG
ncbi:hypothetical protein THIOKS11020015 [Thiocapsa sp. KS1]|nr:hypothetical protein THIOKS11020015 [Thiocapsa sp. KS1]